MLELGERGTGPRLVDVREHRFQLGVVGTLVLTLALLRKPKLILALAVTTAFPVLPTVFRRSLAPRFGETTAVEDARLPAFARWAGGAALALTAAATAIAPSRTTYAAVHVTGAVCIYGAVSGYCVPCNVLMTLENAGVVDLDPPLVCAVRV